MKLILLYVASVLFYSCQQEQRKVTSVEKEPIECISIDRKFRDTIENKIQLLSDHYYSDFTTALVSRYFDNGLVTDSIDDDSYEITSWYSKHGDTIDLVAHISELESQALLLHFIGKKTIVRFFRASHGHEGKYFKVNKADSLSHSIEVKPLYYKLELSEIPDTINNQVIYGYIDMKSRSFYDSRDTSGQSQQIQMKFYFRSQYKHFNF